MDAPSTGVANSARRVADHRDDRTVEAVTNHTSRSIERHCDVAIVGGSAAGLAAALQLGRQRRSVIVIDAGEPRNAPADHMHSFLGHEGIAPSALLEIGREEVRSYGGEVTPGRVERVTRLDGDRFRLELTGAHTVVARRVIAASGLVDELPDIEGLAEHWGGSVIHCPFCHGYEVRDQPLVQIVTHPMSLHVVPLWRQLTPQLTVVLHDVDIEDAEVEHLRTGGVRFVRGHVHRLVSGSDGRLTGVELTDGDVILADAVTIGPRFRVRAEPFEGVGLELVPHPSGFGDVVPVDAVGATPVPGLYAAGNVTEPGLQVLPAAADGIRVGAAVSRDLADEDLRLATRPSANAADWDQRYSGKQLWSGNPNGTMVHEVSPLPSGRALDVGAGEGGDAVWLAEHGWAVTASDVSQRALDRVEAEAQRRGLEVDLLLADANATSPYATGAFDLVSAQYASIPRTPDQRGVRNLLGAVASGGRLLVVSHDLAPMRAPVDTALDSRPMDPDAYVRVGDVVALVEGDPQWEVEVNERRPRPTGAASSHHVDDVVLRVRRR
jgi:thioredoxin reductase/protein-L-isoaspartate O-methyltransferase